MATIASLNVNLTASTAAFAKSLGGARKSLNTFASGAASVKGAVIGLASAIGVGMSAKAFKDFVGGAMESIDTTAKMSDSLGITTEALTGLRHAANLAGADTEAFDSALARMQKTFGDAAIKGGATADLLKKFGINVTEFASMEPDEAFMQVADAIKEIENPAARAAAVTAIFGRAGQKLLPTLMQGSEGLAAASAEADKLGLSFSRVDAAQVEAANDAMTRLGSIFTGLGNQLAIGLSPFIEAAVVKFQELSQAGSGFGINVTSSLEGVSQAVAFFADMWDVVKLAFLTVQQSIMSGLASIVEATASAIQAVIELAPDTFAADFLKGGTDFVNILGEDLRRTSDTLQKELDQAFVARSSGDRIRDFFDDIRAKAQQSATAVAEAASSMTDFEEGAFDAFAKKLEELKKFSEKVIKDTQTPLQEFDSQVTKLREALAEGLITEDVFGKALLQARNDFEKALELPDKLPGRSEGARRGSREAFDKIASFQDQKESPQVHKLEELRQVAQKNADLQKEAVELLKRQVDGVQLVDSKP